MTRAPRIASGARKHGPRTPIRGHKLATEKNKPKKQTAKSRSKNRWVSIPVTSSCCPPPSSTKEIYVFPSKIWFPFFRLLPPPPPLYLPVLWLLTLLPLSVSVLPPSPVSSFRLSGRRHSRILLPTRRSGQNDLCLPCRGLQSKHPPPPPPRDARPPARTTRPPIPPPSFNATDMWVYILTGPTCQPGDLGTIHVQTKRRIPWGLVGPRLLTGPIRGARCPDCVGRPMVLVLLGLSALHAVEWTRA